LDEHSPPGVLKEALEMKDADVDSSSDEDDWWWFEDKGDKDKKKGEGEGEGKEKDYHETSEENLGPGWWAKNVLGEELTAELEALSKVSKAMERTLERGKW
jgi:hypothetical protein